MPCASGNSTRGGQTLTARTGSCVQSNSQGPGLSRPAALWRHVRCDSVEVNSEAVHGKGGTLKYFEGSYQLIVQERQLSRPSDDR